MRGEARPRLKLGGNGSWPVAPVRVRLMAGKVRLVPKLEPSPRERKRKPTTPTLGPVGFPVRLVWVWLCCALITAAFFSALVFRSGESTQHIHKHFVAEIKAADPPGKSDGGIEGWYRLNQALARVPADRVGPILRDANVWLAARGAPGCSVRSAGGRISVVLGAGELSARPLAAAFSGCADAVERALK